MGTDSPAGPSPGSLHCKGGGRTLQGSLPSSINSAHSRLSCTCLQTGPAQTAAEELGFDAEDPDPRNIVMFQLPERLPVPAPVAPDPGGPSSSLQGPPGAGDPMPALLEDIPSGKVGACTGSCAEAAFRPRAPCVLQLGWGRALHGWPHSGPPFCCVGAA